MCITNDGGIVITYTIMELISDMPFVCYMAYGVVVKGRGINGINGDKAIHGTLLTSTSDV